MTTTRPADDMTEEQYFALVDQHLGSVNKGSITSISLNRDQHPLAPLSLADIPTAFGTIQQPMQKQITPQQQQHNPQQHNQEQQQQQCSPMSNMMQGSYGMNPNPAMAAMFMQMATAMMTGQFPMNMNMNMNTNMNTNMGMGMNGDLTMGGMPMVALSGGLAPATQRSHVLRTSPPPPALVPNTGANSNGVQTTGLFQFRCSQCRNMWKRRLIAGQSPYHACRDCRITTFGQPIGSGSSSNNVSRNSFGTGTMNQISVGPRVAYEKLPMQTADSLHAPLSSVNNEWARANDSMPSTSTFDVLTETLAVKSHVSVEGDAITSASTDVSTSKKNKNVEVTTSIEMNDTSLTSAKGMNIDESCIEIPSLLNSTKRKQVRFSSPVAEYDQSPAPQQNNAKRIRTSASNVVGSVNDITELVVTAATSTMTCPQQKIPIKARVTSNKHKQPMTPLHVSKKTSVAVLVPVSNSHVCGPTSILSPASEPTYPSTAQTMRHARLKTLSLFRLPTTLVGTKR